MGKSFTIAVAQMRSVLGGVEENIRRHLEWIERAREEGASLVVFPELGLTGYQLKDMVPAVSLRRDDSRLEPLLRASRHIDVVLGCVEESRDYRYFNAAFYVSRGELVHVHRKVYLPTYGMFDEQRYFAAGESLRAFDGAPLRAGMLICEDFWHASAPYILALDGAQMLLVPAASPARDVTEEGTRSRTVWHHLLGTGAFSYGCYVVFANAVGCEDGVTYRGGSAVVDPEGRVLAEGPLFEEGLVTGVISEEQIRRARTHAPLLRDEDIHLTHRELTRVIHERSEPGP